MSTKTFMYEGDGYKFEVELTLDVDGNVTAKVTAVEGSADFNAFYWGDGNDTADFGGFKGKDSSLNMNGGGSRYEGEAVHWDGAEKITNPGLGKDGEDKFSFVKEGESQTFELKGMSADDFNNLEFFGIRATSVNGDDSLKLVGKPEDEEPPEEPGDFFPEWGQGISNIVLVFDQTEGDEKPKPEGDGYYTVKIDEWDGSKDLDDEIDDILAWLIENDEFVTEDSNLLGVVIKGGVQDTNFYAYGDNDTNGTDPDTPPDGLGISWDGSSNPQPANAVDQSYDYDNVFDFA